MNEIHIFVKVCVQRGGRRLPQSLCSSLSVGTFSEKREKLWTRGEEKPGQEGGLKKMYSFIKNSWCDHPAGGEKDRMKNCSGCDWMTDRDRRQGAEGSEAGLVVMLV